jgi:hypothetical protein
MEMPGFARAFFMRLRLFTSSKNPLLNASRLGSYFPLYDAERRPGVAMACHRATRKSEVDARPRSLRTHHALGDAGMFGTYGES